MPSINKGAESIPFYLTKKVSEAAGAEPNVVNLSRGQAGFLPPQEIYDEAKRVITRDDKTLFRYEKSAGAPELRKSIAKWYGRQYGLDVEPERVAVTAGGTGAIDLALMSFTNYGGQIVIPDPSYPYYTLNSSHRLEGRDITRLAIGKDRVTREALENVIRDNMEMVVLTSPHNPNGVVYDEATLKGILDLAKEKDFWVFYDENHFPEVYDGRRHTPIHEVDEGQTHSIMLGSLARLALQGERIGWAVLPKNVDALSYIAQSPFTSTRSQKLATFVLNNYENLDFDREMAEYEEKRNLLIPKLNSLNGFEVKMPEGTSYAFPNIREFVDKNREKMQETVISELKKRGYPQERIDASLDHNSILTSDFLLFDAGVGVVPGIAYGPNSDDYLRFTFSSPREDVVEAVDRLEKMEERL